MVNSAEVAAAGSGWSPPPGVPPGGGPYSPGGQSAGGGSPPGKPITGGKETMELYATTIDPRTGLPVGERPPASTLAVVSLVFGVLLCLPFSGVVAVGAGALAFFQARRDPVRVGGTTMAVVGILLGLLNVFGWAFGGLLGMVSMLFG